MPDLIASQRNIFDIPRDVAYLNCAYVGPLSHTVIAAGASGIASKVQPWTLTPNDFFEPVDAVRALAASLFGGSAGDYAIVPSASYGVAAAAANLPVEAGQDIVLLGEQFPSNVYSWKRLADEAGASLRFVTRNEARQADGTLDWAAAVIAAISDRTAVVALPHCHWTDGTLVDLARVGPKCRDVDAALVLDLTQSAGARPIDLAEIGADFAVIAAYKWLLGPYATGLFYAAPHRQDGRPLEENWITRDGAENFAGLVDYAGGYQPGAVRYDMGERANFHLLPMLHAALEQIERWGIANIEHTLGEKTQALASRASELGFTVMPQSARASHFAGLNRDGGLPENLVARLAQHNVHVSVRGSTVRVTPHLYNDEDDFDRFAEAMKACLG
ncbi:aminotransferase class V-fold PLP-dependent enzyme [Tepidamorphus sp. 3E244]|uniref:aminotransferase class V-fold PLP-dependent enzyme n=1 Tax=Tepidamorphus sp. 3E244 TaxID=3385498 RepID=UPI0038FCB1DA